MVERLRRWLGRREISLLAVLTCGILSAGLVVSLAQRANTSSDLALPVVSRWDELLKSYLLFRERNYALVAPDDCLPYSKLGALLNEVSFGELQEQPGWYWNFDGGEFVIEPGSELAKQLSEEADLVVYEDMASGEILILRVPEREGDVYREEIVYRAPEWREPMKGEDTETYLWRELSKRRIAWQVRLKSREFAAKGKDSGLVSEFASSESAGVLLFQEEWTNHLWLSVHGPSDGLTGLIVEVHIPEGFTNRVEIFSITNLLSFPWGLAATNLATAGTNSVVWAEPDLAALERCYYAAGNADMDFDGDGLPDARERFLYGTDPVEADTDGDGYSDGVEVELGTDPLVFNPAPQIAITSPHDGGFLP